MSATAKMWTLSPRANSVLNKTRKGQMRRVAHYTRRTISLSPLWGLIHNTRRLMWSKCPLIELTSLLLQKNAQSKNNNQKTGVNIKPSMSRMKIDALLQIASSFVRARSNYTKLHGQLLQQAVFNSNMRLRAAVHSPISSAPKHTQ